MQTKSTCQRQVIQFDSNIYHAQITRIPGPQRRQLAATCVGVRSMHASQQRLTSLLHPFTTCEPRHAFPIIIIQTVVM